MYIKRRVSLEPAAHFRVQAEMARRPEISYSAAVNSLVLNNGRAQGTLIAAARLSLESARRRLETMLGRAQSGSSAGVEELRELQSLVASAAIALE
jgi:hypothetical protein